MMTLLLCLWFLAVETALSQNSSCCQFNNATFIYNCEKCDLTAVPGNIPEETEVLILKRNRIATIKPRVLKDLKNLIVLDLSFNLISSFDNNSFRGLVHLRHLDLSANAYCQLVSSFPVGLFADLSDLEHLNLGLTNCSNKIDESYPDETLKDLRSLQTLQLPGISQFKLGSGFGFLRNLTSLTIDCYSSSINDMDPNAFETVKSLTYLDLRNCDITTIDGKTLTPLMNLMSLNLACNPLGAIPTSQLLANLSTDTLTTLVVDKISKQYEAISLKKSFFPSNVSQTIQRLSIRDNAIVSVDPLVLENLHSLRHISFGYNAILGTTGGTLDIIKLITLVNSMNIQVINGNDYFKTKGPYFSDTYCKDPSLVTEHFFLKPPSYVEYDPDNKFPKHVISWDPSKSEAANIRANIPSSVQLLWFSNIGSISTGFAGDWNINPDNNILMLNMSGTNVYSVSGPMKGMNKLRLMDLSNCKTRNLGKGVANHMPSLSHLYLQKNQLSENKISFQEVFHGASSVKVLDLSENGLRHFDENAFLPLTSLTELYLAGNSLTDVFLNLSSMEHLQTLDLQTNQLQYIDNDFTKELDSHPSMSIKLQNNPFKCNCSSIDFIKWIQNSNLDIVDKENYVCQFKGKSVPILSVDFGDLERQCSQQNMNVIYIAVSSFLVFIGISTIIFSYMLRWKIRWKMYILKRALKRQCGLRPGRDSLLSESETEYDAFISHNHEEEIDWVCNELLPKVENQWGLKLCVGYRDFEAGVPIPENIVNSIDKSRKTILLVTPSFVSSSWCEFEMNMALTRGQDHVIICLLKELDPDKTGKVLRKLLLAINYIEYSEDSDCKQLFWQRLSDALNC